MSDSQPRIELFEQMRAMAPVADDGLHSELLYEQWLTRDSWQLDSEALPLLLGVAPGDWRTWLEQAGLEVRAAALADDLAQDLDVERHAAITPTSLRDWARRHGLALPAAFERLAGFIASVLPSAPPPGAEAAERAQEHERLLGAALALVTRFPDACRDENGFFDGARIADQILAKAVLWFPLEAPSSTREEIAALLENYLS